MARGIAEEPPKPQPLKLMEAARVLDTVAGVVRENHAMLIKWDKMKAIGPVPNIGKSLPPDFALRNLPRPTTSARTT